MTAQFSPRGHGGRPHRVHAEGRGSPERRANTGFVLAKAILGTGGDRARAREIAKTVRALFDPSSDQRARIEASLRDAAPHRD